MLRILDYLPEGFLETPAQQIYQIFPQPTLIHLPGKRSPPLFTSILLHGNETTGYEAMQSLLKKYQGIQLPRAISLFVGNVEAAHYGVRRLEHQPDFNRIWKAGTTAEHAMTHQILEEMKSRGVFASVDIHNNTGLNPHYACVNRLDHSFFHLALLFSRVVVYFIRPTGVQTSAFADLCPSITVECGLAGKRSGLEHAQEFLEACLHLSEIPAHPLSVRDIDLYHTVATVKVPEFLTMEFGPKEADIRFSENLDHLNFTELPAGTPLGWVNANPSARLVVSDEEGRDVGNDFFDYANGEIRTKRPVVPSMLTCNQTIIRQDCLGYIMERMDFSF